MSDSADRWASTLEKWLWLGPASALGLYAGRLLSELLRPGLAGALLITLATIAVSVFALRRKTIWTTWPLLILLIYVLYPEPDPQTAIAVALATTSALLLSAELPGLPLSLSDRKADILVPLLLCAGFLILYVNTMAPGLLPADAGELQLIAARWGIAHPTGFPLYTMLANLMARLPFGLDEAYRTNLFSALTSTATLLLVYAAVDHLSGSRLAGVLAATILGTSATFWSQATTANVRSLTALFTAASFYLLLMLRDRQNQAPANGRTEPDNPSLTAPLPQRRSHAHLWLQALFVFVLVLAVTHHTSLLFIGGLFGLYALRVQPSYLKEPGRWPVLLLAALVALLPLIYLPLRDVAGAIGAPGDLSTLPGFVNHVLGLGFRGDLFFFDQMSVLWARLLVMMNVLAFQFSPIVLLLMLVGLILLFRQDRLLAAVLGASIALHTLVAALYRAPQTVEYMLPAYVLLGLLFGIAAGCFRQTALPRKASLPWEKVKGFAAVLLLTAMIVAVVAQATGNYRSFRSLSQDMTARNYALPLLQDAPPDALILADWHWVTPLWYLQHVEGLRPDIDVQFVFPESDLYAETWTRRILDELADGRAVISTHYDGNAYGDLPPAEPFHEAFLFRQDPLVELPEGYIRKTGTGSTYSIEGYRLSSTEVEPGQELVVQLAWRPENRLEPGRTIYAHLLGPDGRLYAGDDKLALGRAEGLTISQFRLTPLLQASPGIYDLIIGSYGPGLSDSEPSTMLAQIDVQRASSPPHTENHVYRPLSGNSSQKTLIGYDWDGTLPGRQRLYLHWSTQDGYETQAEDIDAGRYDLPGWYGPWALEIAQSTLRLRNPGSYVPFGQGLVWLGQARDEDQALSPGRSITLEQDFTTSRPVLRDLVVSLRLVGYQEDGHSWAWWDLDDGVPAMGAIPTLKWIEGSTVSHPVWPTVSPEASPDQDAEPLLLLYDAFTSRQLPILDERYTQMAPWLPLGRTPVSP